MAGFGDTCGHRQEVLFRHANLKVLFGKFLFNPNDLAVFAQVRADDYGLFAARTKIVADLIERRWVDLLILE
jgi:hypothetical protein